MSKDLRTVDDAADQEIFDYVFQAIATQGRRANSEHKGCVYISSEGLRCAVGCLLSTDELAQIDIDEALGSVADLVCTIDEPRPLLSRHIELLSALQDAHDGLDDSDFQADWAARMRAVATEFQLSPAVIDTALAA